MKKILIVFIKFILFLFKIIIFLVNKIIFGFSILIEYLKGYECEKFKDCVMLYKLKKNQPPASDRYIEYPWMIENLDMKSGRLLDVGSTICDKLYDLLPKAVKIYGINTNYQPVKNKDIEFTIGDIRQTNYQDNYFDCVICISTLEHIGVKGRYNSDNDSIGDLRAMKEIRRILKPNGVLLVTIPYGIKDVLPFNRLYNKERVNKLFEGFEIVSQEFRKFDKNLGVWLKVSESEAAKTDMIKDRWYAIALIRAIKR